VRKNIVKWAKGQRNKYEKGQKNEMILNL